MRLSTRLLITTSLLAGLLALPALAQSGAPLQPQGSDGSRVPPPTVADLVLLLRSYQPDQARIQQLRQEFDEAPPSNANGPTLIAYWQGKAQAAEELQQYEKRTEYLEQALKLLPADTGRSSPERLRLRAEHAQSLWFSRSIATSLDLQLQLITELEQATPRLPGLQVGVLHHIVNNHVHLGNLEGARLALARLDRLLRESGQRQRNDLNMARWTHLAETSRGFLQQREGQLDAAERSFLASIRQAEESIRLQPQREARGLRVQSSERLERSRDNTRIYLAHVMRLQLRLDEAELLLREVLKEALQREGRNAHITGRALWSLAKVYTDRGRYAEAVVLSQWSDRSLQEAGLAPLSPPRLNARIVQANALTAGGRVVEATALIDAMREQLSDDSRLEEGFGQGSLMTIRAYILTGRIEDALRDGDRLLQHQNRHYGASHYSTAEARAYRAMALQRSGRVAEARREFAAALQVLTDPNQVVGKQQTSVARATRLRLILNEYLGLLVGVRGAATPQDQAEAFRIADVARWQTVQKAVAGSALRAAAGSPELGARIKKVQDADDELQAVYKNLITQRSAPPEQQLPAVIHAMERRITDLLREQQRDLVEIRRQFPRYDALVNPRPADWATTQRALRPNEALLSVYVTPAGSYIWAGRAQGPLQFHFSPRPPEWIATQVQRVRASVDLTTNLPPDRLRFDLEAAQALYQELLAPVEGAWQGADTLLVIANDALGQIPFSLLPTGVSPAASSPGLPQAQYRQVPWLARQVAVAYLPSVSALVTLRGLPAPQGRREPFIGFGDPDFGTPPEPGANGTRNLKISRPASWDETQVSADAPVAAPALAGPPSLNALPDTRDEITAIATALQADLQRDTYFGAQANRQNVLASDFRRRRIVAFATHGLVAGDLPGLDQPALALSPVQGQNLNSGLLKLEDILKLSLDADLVVLSACNTAAADGTGAEAVSGLGRGFFYAGARSVLATHWPVETVSARELVTHLFERYARDPQLTRAQALRRAMLDLLDTDVARDPQGRPLMAYAHPAFWSPYALYGDPGR